jgi:hypothetical protein
MKRTQRGAAMGGHFLSPINGNRSPPLSVRKVA